jgi:hypothetical protein
MDDVWVMAIEGRAVRAEVRDSLNIVNAGDKR